MSNWIRWRGPAGRELRKNLRLSGQEAYHGCLPRVRRQRLGGQSFQLDLRQLVVRGLSRRGPRMIFVLRQPVRLRAGHLL